MKVGPEAAFLRGGGKGVLRQVALNRSMLITNRVTAVIKKGTFMRKNVVLHAISPQKPLG